MKDKINVLVTGCGGDIGQSVGKILNSSGYIRNLSGCDISDKNASKFIFSDFSIGLPCTDPKYLDSLKEIIDSKEIDAIIPIAEPELRFYSKMRILDNIGNAKLVMASEEVLRIGFDKLETALFLERQGLPFPTTRSIETVNNLEKFPVILKSKTGSGSSKVNLVTDMDEFLIIKRNNPDYIVQEYLEGDEEEYTCGLFRSKSGISRNIILKRKLTGGYSGYGIVVENKEINDLLNLLATKINLRGSINVQLRLTNKGPVIFEINPRFSSTVLFRHMFGFTDLLWSLEDLFEWELSSYQSNSVGKEFYKGFSEYIS